MKIEGFKIPLSLNQNQIIMLTLTVKKISGPNNTGTTLGTPESMGFQENLMTEIKAIGQDAQFKVGETTYLVDEPLATVLANFIVAGKAGIAVAVGVIDMAIVADRAIGTHDVKDIFGNPLMLPKGAVVINGRVKVATTFTSATDAGTIAIGVETDSAAGLKAAIAISDGANPWDAGVQTALIPVGTAATYLSGILADRKVQFVVAVEALLTGKMFVFIDYIIDPSAV